MKTLLSVILFISTNVLTLAQSVFTHDSPIEIPSTSTYSLTDKLSTDEDVAHFLTTEHRLLRLPAYRYSLRSKNESLTGVHYTYDVFKDNFKIYGAQIKIHTDNSGNVLMVHDNIPEINVSGSANLTSTKDLQWVLFEGQWTLADFKRMQDEFGTISIRHNEQEIDRFNTKLFYHLLDTQVKAQVFLVNPLSSAERGYGSPYIDSSDLDVPALNAERKWVTMPAQFVNDTFWLKTDRYYFGHVSNPVTGQTFALTDTFSFTRSQYQFEDVNAFFHVTNMSNYVEQLGFESALPDTLVIDAHGYSGGDFSSFNYGVTPVELEFGEGGVDDAEDGKIVVHEFAHALAFFAGGDSYASTRDRNAMEEGNADYFCASYSKFYNQYAWDTVFNWDWGVYLGSIPYVLIGNHLQYPQDMTNNSNADREMWSTPLMCIYDKIGRGACDSLVLEHLYYQYKTATIPEMANILLTVDSLLFQKKYHREIRQCFSEHNILLNVETPVAFNQLFTAYNTYNFSQGVAPAYINAISNQSFSYTIYDNIGQLIESANHTQQINLDPESFKSGIYFVELKIDGFTSFLKLMRY